MQQTWLTGRSGQGCLDSNLVAGPGVEPGLRDYANGWLQFLGVSDYVFSGVIPESGV